MKRVHLAWKNLTYEGRRLLIAVSGIAFAVILMFQQRGFQNALFDSTVEVLRQLDCDLVLIPATRYSLSVQTRFPRTMLDVVASQPDIEVATPLYIENLAARLRRHDQKARPIRVLAFDIEQPVFRTDLWEIQSQLEKLRYPQAALMDSLSRSDYGFQLSHDSEFPQRGELNGKQVEVVGTFRSGRDFAHSGNLLMSHNNFPAYFRHRGPDPLSQVDLGLVKVAAHRKPHEMRQELQSLFDARQVHVWTRQELIEREIETWDRNTPIGAIFTVGTIMGFVVGVIICYQVLANAIADHLKEFATLKAMGYGNNYFVQLTLMQSLYLAGLGFVPGWLGSWVLFQLTASFTALPMTLNFERIAIVLLATVAMCSLSGLLALRKLFAADPASLF